MEPDTHVKMVHNGIEYGDMQMICEAYHILRDLLHLAPVEIGKYLKNGTRDCSIHS